MIRTLMIACCFLIIATAQAQTKNIVLHSTLGLSFPGTNNLNKMLSNANLFEVSTAYFSRGGGYFTIFPQTRISSSGYFSTYSGKKQEDAKSSTVRGTQVGTSLGYSLRKSASFKVIPSIGVAYTAFGVHTSRQSPPDGMDLQSYLLGPTNLVHVANTQWAGNVGLHIAQVGFGGGKITEKLVLGLRANYYIPFGTGKWKSNDSELANGPDINSGGLNVSAIIGFAQ